MCGQTRNGACPEVEKVMLNEGCRITDKGLQLLARRCPELTHLQTQYSNISNNTLFDVVTRCTNLQHLDITGKRGKDAIQRLKYTSIYIYNRLSTNYYYKF